MPCAASISCCDLAVDAGQADIETRAQEEGAAGEVEVYLGIDGPVIPELDLPLHGGGFDRAEIAGRPGGAEQVFRGRVRLRQLDVELAILGMRGAVVAGGDVGLSREEEFFGGGHGEILLNDLDRIRSNLIRCEIIPYVTASITSDLIANDLYGDRHHKLQRFP